MNLKERLNNYTSERDLLTWVGDRTLEEFWEECHNGYWMSIVHLMNENPDQQKTTKAGLECIKITEHLMNQLSKELLWATEDFFDGNKSIDIESLQVSLYMKDPKNDEFYPWHGILSASQLVRTKKTKYLVSACRYISLVSPVMEIKTAEILREILPPVSEWKIKATT